MSEELVTCPKDPELHYFRKFCEELFRKGNIRSWCKSCTKFQTDKAGKA